MFKFEIRKAHISDAGCISGLLGQLGYKTPPSTIETLVLAPDNDSAVYVGEQCGNVVAVVSVIYFCYFPSAEKFCRITSIVVDQEVRGAGIGSKLIDHVKSIASAKKCDVLEVTTSLQRAQTQVYYESIGFQKTSYKYVQKINVSADE